MGSLSNWKMIQDTEGGFGGTLMPDQPGATIGRPKLKFNFTAKFIFRAGFTAFGADKMEELDVQLKEATRPTITVSYTDVNQYNFRTKVATKVDYGSVSLSYYDDPQNKAHNVLTRYLKQISPIAQLTSADGPPDIFGRYSSLGTLSEDIKMSPIERIKVSHYYVVSGGDTKKVVYEYLNPKLEKLDYGSLSMVENDTTLITMNLVYDSVYINEE